MSTREPHRAGWRLGGFSFAPLIPPQMKVERFEVIL
jgi:hypothetical protein